MFARRRGITRVTIFGTMRGYKSAPIYYDYGSRTTRSDGTRHSVQGRPIHLQSRANGIELGRANQTWRDAQRQPAPEREAAPHAWTELSGLMKRRVDESFGSEPRFPWGFDICTGFEKTTSLRLPEGFAMHEPFRGLKLPTNPQYL